MQLDRSTLRHAGVSEDLTIELARSRFSYFRMLAHVFEVRTCEAFRDVAAALPITAVQGDAHVEQFAVTQDSFGLDDFDRAGFGPAVVDLVRYAASLHVACADVGWRCDAAAAVERFLTTYRATSNSELPLREPAVVERMRARAPRSRTSWLAGVDTRIVPLAPSLEVDVRRSWVPFASLMRSIHPKWTHSAMSIVRLGGIRIGVGSALERKLLIRIEGATEQPEDDVVIEAREGLAPQPQSCVWRGSPAESPVLMVMATIGRRMPELHGFAAMLGSRRWFWLQSWDQQYVELSLADVTSQAELEELAIDAALQLAGQLWSGVPERLRRYQQSAQAAAFDATRPRIVRLARALAIESNHAWDRFRGRRDVER